jgi:NhaA family Na+:H+ antiporter
VNDALMVVFFFVVGLEVKREFVSGELSQWQRASLPVLAAVGGMMVPALLYAAFNYGGPAARGWGIPMATDIAFALGAMALLGDRLPSSLRVFLLALATVDDIGAILVIALFYSEGLSLIPLMTAALIVAGILMMRRVGIRRPLYYVPVGMLFWLAVLESGVHATIAGVVLGFLTPVVPWRTKVAISEDAIRANGDDARGGVNGLDAAGPTLQPSADEGPADQLIARIHPWSSFAILPIFALANAGVNLSAQTWSRAAENPVTWGIALGLVVGKVIGIVAFAWIAVRLGIAKLLTGVGWSQMIGVGLLGGIGFTVSLFISDLAFLDAATTESAKLGIMIASSIAGLAGLVALWFASTTPLNRDAKTSAAAI